jgi:hypothetical protein
MAGLLDVFGAIKAGKEIANPEMWKNVGNLAGSIFIVLSAVVTLYRIFVGELAIPDDQLIKISGAIATLLMTGRNVLAVITTKKNVSLIGVPKPTLEEEK